MTIYAVYHSDCTEGWYESFHKSKSGAIQGAKTVVAKAQKEIDMMRNELDEDDAADYDDMKMTEESKWVGGLCSSVHIEITEIKLKQ